MECDLSLNLSLLFLRIKDGTLVCHTQYLKRIFVHIQRLLKIDKTRNFYAYIVLQMMIREIPNIWPHQRS